MSFLAPLFLVGILAAAIPVAIHLFHRRTEPVIEFSAMRYLRRAPVEHSRRRRLRELLLLALRVCALLLFAFAFARPYFLEAGEAFGAPATIVLIDNSASLSAPRQFERARERAQDAIGSVPASHTVGVATFAAGLEVLAPVSADRAPAYAAVAALEPSAGATRYRAALVRGAELLGGRSGRLVVITDLQETGWDTSESGGVPEQIEVSIEDIGAPHSNIAVTSLRVDGGEAVAVVQNFSTEDAKEQITFTLEDRPAGAVLLRVPPRGTVEARVDLQEHAGTGKPRILAATVTDQEGYAADNSRYTILDGAAAPAVLGVTASGHPSEVFFLERALTIATGENGFRFTARGGPSFSDLTAEALDEFDVVAILGTRGIERRGHELLANYVRAGGGLLLTAGPDVDGAQLASVLKDVVHTTWRPRDEGALAFAPDDSRHPVFRKFGGVGTLGNVTFRRSVAMDAPHTATVLARYTDGTPALVEEQAGAGRVLVFASDLNDRWNDFPVQPAFVPFVHEMLRYLAAPRSRRVDYLVGELPGVAGMTPGVAAQAGRSVAINVDPRESDPARMDADAFLSGVLRLNATATRRAASQARDREHGQRLWQAALLLMVIGLAAEGVLGRRLG
jgi:hypothetical protein